MTNMNFIDQIRQVVREEVRRAIVDVFKTFKEIAEETKKCQSTSTTKDNSPQ